MVEKISGGADHSGPLGDAPHATHATTPVEVQPLDVDGIRTVQVGTALWGLALLALLPFWSLLQESGNLWWIWTCSAGLGIGLLGIEYCRRRRERPTPTVAARLQVPPAARGGRRRA